MNLFHRHYGEGPPVVILHGFLGQSDNWASIAKMLGERHFSVFCMDIRNHGHSPHNPEFSYPLMADDVAETIHDLRISRKVHIIGHSMGGKVAMFFAQKYPELLKSIVVVDIGPRYYPPHHQEVFKGLNAVNLSSIQTRSDAEKFMTPHISDQSVRQFLLKNLFRDEEGSFTWRFNLKILEKKVNMICDATPEGIVDVPALFYHGGASNYLSTDEYPVIMKQFISAEFRQMQGAGHWLHAEQPLSFVETIDHWFKRFTS